MTPAAAAVRVAMAVATAATIVAVSRDVLDRAGAWGPPAVVGACLALAFAVPTAHAHLPAGAFPLLVLAVAATAYACVPETDPLLALAIVPAVAGVTELAGRRPVPPAAMWAVASLVLWAAVHGATGRGSALVGALFAWWPVVLAGAIGVSRRPPQGWWRWTVVLAPAWLATVGVARSGALSATTGPALADVAVAAPVSLVATAALAFALRPQRAG